MEGAQGIGLVMVGLMLFLEGLKHGLMPFSENIGHLMPQRFSPASCRVRRRKRGSAFLPDDARQFEQLRARD
jgi:hypothetical protein